MYFSISAMRKKWINSVQIRHDPRVRPILSSPLSCLRRSMKRHPALSEAQQSSSSFRAFGIACTNSFLSVSPSKLRLCIVLKYRITMFAIDKRNVARKQAQLSKGQPRTAALARRRNFSLTNTYSKHFQPSQPH